MEIEDPSLSAGLHLAAITSPRIYRTALAPLSKSNPPDTPNIILIPIFHVRSRLYGCEAGLEL